MFEDLVAGWSLLASTSTLLVLVCGLLAGFAVGVIPGFSGPTAAVILLPFTMLLEPQEALILIIAIYAGASFSGAVPAILLNVPGGSGDIATTLDGYPMTRQGKAGLAIGVARMASVLGGVLGVILILPMLPPFARIAIQIGPPEIFLIALLAIIVVSTVVGKDIKRGLMAGLLGVLIATMAADPISAQGRVTFGFIELYEGVPLVPAVVGIFAFSEMFLLAASGARTLAPSDDGPARRGVARILGTDSLRELLEGIRVTLGRPVNVVRSATIGAATGAVPGLGGSVASLVSYGVAKRRRRSGPEFGKGNPDGIIASEACDNAVAAGTLLPTLTLGIPGNITTAVMLAALYLQGVQPGPQVMANFAPEAYAVFLGLALASVLILPLGIVLSGLMIKLVRLRLDFLVPMVLLVASVGAFAVRNTVFDIALAFVFGLLGVLLRMTGFPTIPLLIGLILGPIAEASLLRALAIGKGEVSIFWQSGISQVLLAGLALVVVVRLGGPLWRSWLERRGVSR